MTSLNTIGKFFNYENIPLKVFMKVIETGNFKLVLKFGVATVGACVDVWEQIIIANHQARGKQEYIQFLKAQQAMNRLLKEFNAVKSRLLILCYVIDYEAIKFVRARGYKIDLKNSATYAASLAAAIPKANNILTKLAMKRNELLRMGEENKGQKMQSFESVLATLSLELGFTVSDDLTLSRYNEYIKLIEQRAKAMKAMAQRQTYGRRT